MMGQLQKLGLRPGNLGADQAYGSGEFLAWLLARGVQPHIPVIDRRHRTGGHFTRDQFRYRPAENVYYCPEGKPLRYGGQHRTVRGSTYCSTAAQCQGVRRKRVARQPPIASCSFTGMNHPAKWYGLGRAHLLTNAREELATRSKHCLPNSNSE
jgi:hypothetical protein